VTFILNIECNNAAFADDLAGELSAIIGRCAETVAEGVFAGTLRDVNGNRVGTFELDEPVEAMEE
jgi:hypothetical protein